MTDEQIANLRRLAEQATPGQWRTFVRSTDGMADDFLGVDLEGPPDAVRGQFARKEDVDFIVAARTAVPELLDALVAMTQRAEQAEREANSWIQAADDERTKLRHALAIARGRAEAAEAAARAKGDEWAQSIQHATVFRERWEAAEAKLALVDEYAAAKCDDPYNDSLTFAAWLQFRA